MPDNYGTQDAWVNTNLDPHKWIRIDPEEGGLYRYNSDTGEFDIPLPIILEQVMGLPDALAAKTDLDHSHPTHGNINFTGTVSADGDAGVTGQRTIGGYTLTFKKGLLVGFQPP